MKTIDDYGDLFCKIMTCVLFFALVFSGSCIALIESGESGRRYKIEHLSTNGSVERVDYSRRVWHKYGAVNYTDENGNIISTSETVRIVRLN